MKDFSLSGFEDFPLSDRGRLRIQKAIRRLSFKKGDAVFRQGEVCPDIYLIRSGLVKLSYLTLDGKEFIKSFIQEGKVFGSLYSQLHGGGSTFNAVALEDLHVEVVAFSVFQEAGENHPPFQEFILRFFQQLALKKEIREYELLCLSAQQRYEKFCQQRPDLVKRVKQAELALYLGVTPIALSRMKNRQKV